MNAIQLLTEQHSEVKALFLQIQEAGSVDEKKRLADSLADRLAIHATIEERHFYPRLMSPETQEELREAVEEHLSAKRLLGDLIQCDPHDPQYMAKVTVLEKEIAAHVMEEEGVLFKRAESMWNAQDLEVLGNAMASMARELRTTGSPRHAISEQTAAPAPLPPVAPAEGADRPARP